MDRYFEMEDATSDAITEDGWLRTGDLCAMDERGCCTVEGRLKDMIIRGGEEIAHHKAPAHWIWGEDLPLTGSGKIQKYALRVAWVNREYS